MEETEEEKTYETSQRNTEQEAITQRTLQQTIKEAIRMKWKLCTELAKIVASTEITTWKTKTKPVILLSSTCFWEYKSWS